MTSKTETNVPANTAKAEVSERRGREDRAKLREEEGGSLPFCR
jgi:hypothetical protein